MSSTDLVSDTVVLHGEEINDLQATFTLDQQRYLGMAVPADLKKLDEYLLSRSYITGYQASKDDITVLAALAEAPSAQYVNVLRWRTMKQHVFMYVYVAGEEEDDDDVDIFGEETEEEKKAAEEHAASIKASAKKKVCEFPLLLCSCNIAFNFPSCFLLQFDGSAK
ncbi:hypothetical protein ACLB2K_044026 [Fragaria x ananassa]